MTRIKTPTEIALTSGCSLSPNPQLCPKLPASRHKLVHGLWNNMVARGVHQDLGILGNGIVGPVLRRKNGRQGKAI